ncbi:MAG: hypothetical protein HN685_04995 [Waddliaceae bacterium]|nr:hypothetical protein [Waddliaceae bacterium]
MTEIKKSEIQDGQKYSFTATKGSETSTITGTIRKQPGDIDVLVTASGDKYKLTDTNQNQSYDSLEPLENDDDVGRLIINQFREIEENAWFSGSFIAVLSRIIALIAKASSEMRLIDNENMVNMRVMSWAESLLEQDQTLIQAEKESAGIEKQAWGLMASAIASGAGAVIGGGVGLGKGRLAGKSMQPRINTARNNINNLKTKSGTEAKITPVGNEGDLTIEQPIKGLQGLSKAEMKKAGGMKSIDGNPPLVDGKGNVTDYGKKAGVTKTGDTYDIDDIGFKGIKGGPEVNNADGTQLRPAVAEKPAFPPAVRDKLVASQNASTPQSGQVNGLTKAEMEAANIDTTPDGLHKVKPVGSKGGEQTYNIDSSKLSVTQRDTLRASQKGTLNELRSSQVSTELTAQNTAAQLYTATGTAVGSAAQAAGQLESAKEKISEGEAKKIIAALQAIIRQLQDSIQAAGKDSGDVGQAFDKALDLLKEASRMAAQASGFSPG